MSASSPECRETTGTENLSFGGRHAASHIQLQVKLPQSWVQFEEVCGKAEL